MMVLILYVQFMCAFEVEDVETNAKYSGFWYSLNALFVTKNMTEPWARLYVLGGGADVYNWFHN